MRASRLFSVALWILGNLALSAQPSIQHEFPCQVLDFALRGQTVEATCGLPQSKSFDFQVRVYELDANGDPVKDVQGNIIAPRNARLALDTKVSAQRALLSLEPGAANLEKGKSYRITTLDTYSIDGQPTPFVVEKFDFDFPPKLRFPCRFTDYRITSPTTLRFMCAARIRSPLNLDVTISEIVKGVPGSPRTGRLTLDPNIEGQWSRVTIPDSSPLSSDKTYRIESLPSYSADPNDHTSDLLPYNVEKLDFTTSNEITVAIPFGSPKVQPLHSEDGRRRYLIASKIAIDESTLDTPQLKRGIASLYEDLPVLRTKLDANFYKVMLDDSSDQIGRVFVWIADPGPKNLNTHLTVLGLKNVLGAELEVPKTARLKLPGAPTGKDDATVFGKFLNQAGPGAKPGWAADIKFAPALAYAGAGFFFNLQILADVGLGSVEDNKTTNTIKAGTGVTRFVPTTWGYLPGLQITPDISFETDRQGHHQNLLFDGDVQFFGAKWRHSIQDQTDSAYATAALGHLGDPPDPASIPIPKIGFLFQAFLGTEVGGALSADSVKSSDETSNVILPKYSIARLRPKVTANLELQRLSLSLSVTPRYLFTAENVTRERQAADASDPSKQGALVYLHQAKGFRPYGEAGISYQLDNEGHISLSVTYKLGSAPPNFDYVNTVQTGFVFKY